MRPRLVIGVFLVGAAVVWLPLLAAQSGLIAVPTEPQVIALAVGSALTTFAVWFWPANRSKPDGYVGRFRRPDGVVVHVIRHAGGLMVATEEPQGKKARDLGNVSGRELARWEKLGSAPDEGLARAD
jgi:hypothetical protein